MPNENRRLQPDSRAAALDASEVKALFEARRNEPGAIEALRAAFERLKHRLTPGGRTAFRRELARLLEARSAVPRSIDELLDGEYGLAVRGDDCSEALATVRCHEGRIEVELPLTCIDARCRVSVAEEGSIDTAVERKPNDRLEVRGDVAVRDGFMFMNLKVSGTVDERAVRLHLVGSGDVRAGRA